MTEENDESLPSEDTIVELAKVEEETKTSWKNVLLWSFYDAADTIFAMGIISMTLYQWGELVGMKAGYAFADAHFLVSLFLMISNISLLIIMPIFGAHSDIVGKRKPFVLIFGGITIILTPLIVLTGNFMLGLIIFTVANICYQGGILYYEGMIPYISETEKRGKVSAFGIAFGFLGTIVAILLIFLLPMAFGSATIADDVIDGIIAPQDIKLNWVTWMFVFVAITYLLLAIPFLWTKEKTKEQTEKVPFGRMTKSTFTQLGRTIKEIIKENKMFLLFILVWFFINDAVGTAIAMLVDYLREGLGFPEMTSGIIMFVGLIIGISFLFIMGPIIDRKGPKLGLLITTFAFCSGIILAACAGLTYKTETILIDTGAGYSISTTLIHKLTKLVYPAAILLSFGMGSVWVVGRQYTFELAPPEKIGQYIGIKSLSGKLSASFGPLIFSAVLKSTIGLGKSIGYMIAISTLMGIFLIGFLISLFIKDKHKEYLRGERFPYRKEENAPINDS